MQGDVYLHMARGGRTEKYYGSEVAQAVPARPSGKGKVQIVGMCRR